MSVVNVRDTEKVLPRAGMRRILLCGEEEPSPKSHVHEIAFPVESSVNRTVRGTLPEVLSAEKCINGIFSAESTVIWEYPEMGVSGINKDNSGNAVSPGFGLIRSRKLQIAFDTPASISFNQTHSVVLGL
jgi:hypothetical protein